MLISLHKQATTTPRVRAAIQASTEPAWVLAERFGTTAQTIWKWRKRSTVQDRSHTPHRLQTTLMPSQEAVAVVLRRSLLLSLDDLLAVVREFLNPQVSRSGLDRCLRRHGAGNLRDLVEKVPRPQHKPFKAYEPGAYEPGYLHIDVKYLPQMPDETRRPLSAIAAQSPAGQRPPVRGHRPCHPLGLRAHLQQQNRRQCAAVPARSRAGLPSEDHAHSDR